MIERDGKLFHTRFMNDSVDIRNILIVRPLLEQIPEIDDVGAFNRWGWVTRFRIVVPDFIAAVVVVLGWGGLVVGRWESGGIFLTFIKLHLFFQWEVEKCFGRFEHFHLKTCWDGMIDDLEEALGPAGVIYLVATTHHPRRVAGWVVAEIDDGRDFV